MTSFREFPNGFRAWDNGVARIRSDETITLTCTVNDKNEELQSETQFTGSAPIAMNKSVQICHSHLVSSDVQNAVTWQRWCRPAAVSRTAFTCKRKHETNHECNTQAEQTGNRAYPWREGERGEVFGKGDDNAINTVVQLWSNQNQHQLRYIHKNRQRNTQEQEQRERERKRTSGESRAGRADELLSLQTNHGAKSDETLRVRVVLMCHAQK